MRDLPNAAHGEQAAMQEIAGGAPMALAGGALSPTTGGAPGPGGGAPMDVVPFGAPSQHPGMPVTAGADMGAGPGPAVLGLSSDQELLRKDRESLAAYLPVLEFLANRPDAMPSMRSFVRKVKSAVGK